MGVLKKHLVDTGNKWVEQLYTMLWAYHTTPKHLMGLSLFDLAYGFEAILPTELIVMMSRTRSVEEGVNNELLSHDEALLDETRLQAMEYIMKYQQDTNKRYDEQVK